MRYYPQCIRDINGNNMYLLTNNGVSYRRETLPQGSGTITGLVVREYNSNFGGDLGKFSIRQLEKSDISIADERTDGFSTVLLEWDCAKPKTFTDGVTFLPPSEGLSTANLNKTNALGFFEKYGLENIYFGTEFRGNILPGGSAANSTYISSIWDTNNWWIIDQLSTVGISNPISLQIETNSLTDTGPRDFVVEYSLDGTSWLELENGKFISLGQIREKVPAGVGYEGSIPGMKIHDFLLPAELLGQENIHIRIRCNSDFRVDGTTGSIKGTHRLAHVSIKYNK